MMKRRLRPGALAAVPVTVACDQAFTQEQLEPVPPAEDSDKPSSQIRLFGDEHLSNPIRVIYQVKGLSERVEAG